MADVLKATLYFNAVPTLTEFDNTGSGNVSHSEFASAAQSHDANDGTNFNGDAGGDGDALNGNASWYQDAVVTTASVSGDISFIRLKIRARREDIGGATHSAIWQPRINGVNRGSTVALSTSYAGYSQDFATDPADSAPWTNAKLNAQTLGFRGDAFNNSPFATTVFKCPEFEIEVWGPDVQVLAPSSAGAVLASGAMSLVASALAYYFGGAAAVLAGSTPTLLPGSVALALESANIDTLALDEAVLEEPRNPTAFTPQAQFVDTASSPTTIRSFRTILADENAGTYATLDQTNNGTHLEALYGTASQGIVGNAINGFGPIAGIKLFALVRCARSASSSLTNIRFGTAGGVKALLTAPTIRDYDAGLDDTMWQVVETDVIETNALAHAFEWGSGVDSFWAFLFGWTFNHTRTNVGGHTRVDVAEAWVEVIAPVGSDVETVYLTQRIGNVRRIQAFPDTLTTE